MLLCVPLGLCSRDYRVLAADESELALVNFDYFSETGTIEFEGATYEIRKHGPFRGTWSLETNGHSLMEIYKPSALFRQFDFQTAHGQLDLSADSALTRAFTLTDNGRTVAQISPVHAFTRRATIDHDDNPLWLELLFAFWIVALMWRRAENNQSS